MKISKNKPAKEENVTLGQVDGVVVNGGGPVNTTNFRKDFEEAAKRLEELLKIGNTTTGDGKPVKAEQLDIKPAGTPNPAKEGITFKSKRVAKEDADTALDTESKKYMEEHADALEALKETKSKKASKEDFSYTCIIPDIGEDVEDWKQGICNLPGFKAKPEFKIINGKTLKESGYSGNCADDSRCLVFPMKAYERAGVESALESLGAVWMENKE